MLLRGQRIYDESNVASVSVKYTRAIAYKRPTGAINTFPSSFPPPPPAFASGAIVVSLAITVKTRGSYRHRLETPLPLSSLCFRLPPPRGDDQLSARYFAMIYANALGPQFDGYSPRIGRNLPFS